MTCFRLDLVLAVAACLGVSISTACNPENLLKCAQTLFNMDASVVNDNSHDYCQTVLKAADCLKAEAVDCPSSAGQTLELVQDALKQHSENCDGNHRTSEIGTLTYQTGCTRESIMACSAPLSAMGHNIKSEENLDPCGVLSTAKACLAKQTAICPQELRSLLTPAKEAMSMIAEACNDPDSIDLSGMENCKLGKLQECNYEIQRLSQGRDARKSCLAVGTALRCIGGVKSGCESKFARSMIEKAETVYEDLATKCDERGYSTNTGKNVQPTVLSLLAFAMFMAMRYIL